MIPKYLAGQMRDWATILKGGKIVQVRHGLAQAIRLLGEGKSTPEKRILTGLLEAWLDNLADPSSWTMDRIYEGLKDVAKDIEDQPCE
jgi:hypothetical protein